MSELRKAVEAAGKELEDEHGLALDVNPVIPIIETTFAKVVLKHIQPIVDPGAAEIARKARIAALRAELAELEKKQVV